jgi:hypothetical protein
LEPEHKIVGNDQADGLGMAQKQSNVRLVLIHDEVARFVNKVKVFF